MSQQFNDPMADAAAAMHCGPARLVDDKQALVFVQDVVEHCRRLVRWRRLTGNIDPGRGHAHLVTVLQAVVGPYAAAVDPYLAAAQQSIQAALRDAR